MGLLDELPDDWREKIGELVDPKDIQKIERNLASAGKICPERDDIFKAFHLCPFQIVNAVIVGQDPYTNRSATGLAFAVKRDKKISPSLRNIFRRIEASTGTRPQDTELEGWAQQGVLLLNSILTADSGAGKAGSHRHWGWQKLTVAAVDVLKQRSRPVVFLVWGRHAEKVVGEVVGPHEALVTSHPSSKSYSTGFCVSDHFYRTSTIVNWGASADDADYRNQPSSSP